jgi:hypothetical protein
MDWIRPLNISEKKSQAEDGEIGNGFDAIMWGLVEDVKKDRIDIILQKQAFKTEKNVTPSTDLGHKYHMLMRTAGVRFASIP